MRLARILLLIIYLIEYILAFNDRSDLKLESQIFGSLDKSQKQNDIITDKKKSDFIYYYDQLKNHTYSQEDILLSAKKKMYINQETPTCNQQTTPIKEIVCDQNSCTSLNSKLIQVNISNLKQFTVCLQSEQSFIDLSNIQFVLSQNQSTTITLQADTVKLANLNIQNHLTDATKEITFNIISYNLMELSDSQITLIANTNLVSNGKIKLQNATIQSQKVRIVSQSDFSQDSFTLIGIQNSFNLVAENNIELNQFQLGPLALPIKKLNDMQNNDDQYVNIISTKGFIKITNKSSISVKNTNMKIQANQIIISNSSLETQSKLTIQALDLVSINSTVINSKFAYIYHQRFSQSSSSNRIIINNTEIITSGRMCKTWCGNQQNFQQNQINNQCKVDEYYPYISLLRDSSNGQFQISQTFQTYDLIQYVDLISLMKRNYTAIIFSLGTLQIMEKTTILASNLGVYATQVSLEKESVLSSENMGCQGTQGLGGGIIDIVMRMNLKCGGPGGSHGSPGGSPLSEQDEYNQLCSQIGSQSIYGNKNDPIFEGSGGGGYVVPPISNDFKSNDDEHLSYTEQYAGAGGGVIYIEAFNILLEGVVNASGGQPSDEYSYLGSGSGGSIQIHTEWMVGNGFVKANGGNRNYQGGEGGGGRIKINMTNWYQMSNDQLKNMSSQNNVQVHVRQGLPKVSDPTKNNNFFYQNGSFIATPCQPGYQPKYELFACEQCPFGFYKNSFNLEQCRPCLNSDNSRFDFQVDEIQTNSSCEYICQREYQTKMVNHIKACITNGELFVDSLGGSNIIFFVVLLIVSILLNLIVICITKRLNMQKKMLKSIISSNQADKSKVRLTIEDLPFHQQRFYIEGENTYNKPWVINDQVKSDIIHVILSGYKSIEQSDLDQLGLLRQNILEGKKSNDSGFITYYDYSNNYSYDIELSHDYQYNSAHNTQSKNQQFASIWDYIKIAFSYSKWERFILTVLKYIYPYGYYIQGDIYKKQKWKKMKKIMKKFQTDLKQKNSSIRVKFSCTSCYCQAYFDIVDYTKTELQWDIESKMPLCLLLQGKGSFMSPFYLNNRDPLFVLLITYLKSKIDLNYLKCGEMNSHDNLNNEKNNIFKEWEFSNGQYGNQKRNKSEDQLNDQFGETDQLDDEQIATRKRKISQIASSLLSRTSTFVKNRQKSKIGSFEMVDADKEHKEYGLSNSEESKLAFCQYNLEEEEDLSYQLIHLVECFFNKLNTYSRTICYSLKFNEFRKRFLRFMKFISDHQDIFEVFDIYIQVNIHKIQKEDQKQEKDQQEKKKVFFNNFQVFEEEYSSVIILPQKIIPGSVGEKQLESLLYKTYERKREFNDFEYKISLIFSKEKIYEFNKQYVQKMPTINKQLEWICQSKKNQVKILIQHAEQENQFQEQNQNEDKTKKNNNSSQSKIEETFDSNYEMCELKGLTDEIVVVDYAKTPQFERASFSSKNNSYSSKYNRGSTFGKSFNGSDSQQAQNPKHNKQQFFLNSSVKEEIEEENKDEKENLEQYNGEFYLDSGVEQNNGFKQNVKKLINKIVLLFSLFKASVLTYRIVENKILNNNYFLKTLLFLFILTKLIFFWFLHIRPFGLIYSGGTTVYDNIVIAIQAFVYPLSSILSAFYQIVWIIKQDQHSGKLCMILNTMEIFALIIVIPLQIPQVLLHHATYLNFILNQLYLLSNLIQGYLGSIYLLQNQEKQIQLCDEY
ncbi:hypothetical protein ABPG72_001589 [Tetrahymena utriculariae]